MADKMEIIGIDCEMVLAITGTGEKPKNALARVSIVDQNGVCIYDKYVIPMGKIVNYNTKLSGIRKKDLDEKGEDVLVVRAEVAEILHGRLLVGHALGNDFRALGMKHPKKHTRDTQKFPFFQKAVDSKMPSLKLLCKHFLGREVQKGEHDSIEDAKAAVDLYMRHREMWENGLIGEPCNRVS